MEKPISMRIEEVKNQFINTINQSKLPTYIILPIIKDLYEQINKLDKENIQREKTEYEESLKGE